MEWTGKVDVDSIPHILGFFPKVDRGGWWVFPFELTVVTLVHDIFNILVDRRSPDVLTGQQFHSDNSGMSVVKFFEDSWHQPPCVPTYAAGRRAGDERSLAKRQDSIVSS